MDSVINHILNSDNGVFIATEFTQYNKLTLYVYFGTSDIKFD